MQELKIEYYNYNHQLNVLETELLSYKEKLEKESAIINLEKNLRKAY